MRIASFVRDGQADCGVVDGDALLLLDHHPVLGPTPPAQRLSRLLAADPSERDVIASQLAEAPRLELARTQLLPAVPDCPLYLVAHGNSPTVWHRQTRLPREVPRIPYMRIRPWSSLSGSDATVRLPPEAAVSGGTELGVVVGKPAHHVAEADALQHIAGLVLLNDLFIHGAHTEFLDPDPVAAGYQNQGLHTLYKGASGAGPMGPWITTSEELAADTEHRLAPEAIARYSRAGLAPWIYDRLLRTHVNGALADESYTAGYLLGAEWMLAFLSRFMSLPTGTVIGLGAAGWDGVELPDPGTGTTAVSVSAGGLGELRTQIVRGEPQTQPGERAAGPAVWMLRGNTAEPDTGVTMHSMNPLLYPSAVLGSAGTPVQIPAHATTLALSAQLAGVVGPGGNINTVCAVLSLRDRSPGADVTDPLAYEQRAAYFLGGCADGFVRTTARLPVTDLGEPAGLTISLSVNGAISRTFQLAAYRHSLAQMQRMVGRTVALMPGDLLCLGPAGVELEVGRDTVVTGITLEPSWGSGESWVVEDRRATG